MKISCPIELAYFLFLIKVKCQRFCIFIYFPSIMVQLNQFQKDQDQTLESQICKIFLNSILNHRFIIFHLPAYFYEVSKPLKAHQPWIALFWLTPQYNNMSNLPVCFAFYLSQYSFESFKPNPYPLKIIKPFKVLFPTQSFPEKVTLYFEFVYFLISTIFVSQVNFYPLLALILMVCLFFTKEFIILDLCSSLRAEGNYYNFALQSYINFSIFFFLSSESFFVYTNPQIYTILNAPPMAQNGQEDDFFESLLLDFFESNDDNGEE